MYVYLYIYKLGGGACPQHVEVSRPGKPHHSSDPSPCSNNAGSLTCCTTRELNDEF